MHMVLSIQGQVVNDTRTLHDTLSLYAKCSDAYTTPCFDNDGTGRCRQDPFEVRAKVPAVEAHRADDQALSTVLPIVCCETDIVVAIGVGALRVFVEDSE